MHLHIIEHNSALLDVHGSRTGDIGLERHGQERYAVDGKKEFVPDHDIVKGQLPIQIIILQSDWE